MPVCGRDPADGQAEQDVAVGGAHRCGRRHGNLELSRPGLGLDLVDVQALLLESRHEVGGELLDLEQAGGAEGRPPAQWAREREQGELDLEGDLERETAGGRRALHAAQERPLAGRCRQPILVDLIHGRPCQPRRPAQPHGGVDVRHHPEVAGRPLEPVQSGQVGGVIVDREDPDQGRHPDTELGHRGEPADRDHLEPRDSGVVDHGDVDEAHALFLELGDPTRSRFRHAGSPLAASTVAITPATSATRSAIDETTIRSAGLWSSSPIGPRPSSVGIPRSAVQLASETPPVAHLDDGRPERRRDPGGRVEQPLDGRRALERRHPHSGIEPHPDTGVVAEPPHLGDRPVEIVGAPAADVDPNGRVRRDRVQHLAGREQGRRHREAFAGAVELGGPQHLVTGCKQGAAAATRGHTGMRGEAVGGDRHPLPTLASGDDAVSRPAALHAQDGVKITQPVEGAERALTQLLVGHRHELDAAVALTVPGQQADDLALPPRGRPSCRRRRARGRRRRRP